MKRTTQLSDEVVKRTSYTVYSGNVTPSLCHCDHNKINTVVVAK
jgi:hypothetical protein